MLTGITEVVVALGQNRNLKYMLEGSTLVLWIGEMLEYAPDDATTGHIGMNGDSFQITLREDDGNSFMPATPPHLM